MTSCNICGKKIDPGLILCPHCGQNPAADPTLHASAHAKTVARMVYAHIGRRILAWLSLLSLIFGIGMLQAYKSATKALETLIVRHVEQEFAQPRIHETVAQVADAQSRELLSNNVMPEVNAFSARLHDYLARSSQELARAKSAAEFAELITRAEHDHRPSWYRLQQVADDMSSPYRDTALTAFVRQYGKILAREDLIHEAIEYPDEIEEALTIPRTMADLNSLTNITDHAFSEMYRNTPTWDRPNALVVMWVKCTRMSEYRKLSLLAEVIEHSMSTKEVLTAMTLMDTRAKMNKHLSSQPEEYIEWWHSNRRSYEEDDTRLAFDQAREDFLSISPEQATNDMRWVPYNLFTNRYAPLLAQRAGVSTSATAVTHSPPTKLPMRPESGPNRKE